MSETTCKSFKRGTSISYSTLGPLDVSATGFLSQMFWGSFFGAAPRVWSTRCEAPSPRGSWRSSSLFVCVPLRMGFFQTGSASSACLDVVLWSSSLLEAVYLDFRTFRRKWSTGSYRFHVSMEGDKFRTFLCSSIWVLDFTPPGAMLLILFLFLFLIWFTLSPSR